MIQNDFVRWSTVTKTQLNDQVATSLPNHGYCLCSVVHPQCIPSQIGRFLIRSAHFLGVVQGGISLDNHVAHIVPPEGAEEKGMAVEFASFAWQTRDRT